MIVGFDPLPRAGVKGGMTTAVKGGMTTAVKGGMGTVVKGGMGTVVKGGMGKYIQIEIEIKRVSGLKSGYITCK